MLPTVQYAALQDYSALPLVRQICANHGLGIIITDIPVLEIPTNFHLEQAQELRIVKNHDSQTTTRTTQLAQIVMHSLHRLSHILLNNISHALELPWEKYLSEMHEFGVAGRDELRMAGPCDNIQQEWSTLTIVVSLGNPREAYIFFGEALSVFSDAMTPKPTSAILSTEMLPKRCEHGRLVYYVRPNDDVMYTRAAGALMRHLSSTENDVACSVRDISGGAS